MKWYQPYNLSIPLVIIIGCIVIGAVQGSRRADKIIAARTQQIEDPHQFRAELRSRFITGNLIIGTPFALVLFFALMPFNRKHRRKRPQNKSVDHNRQPAGAWTVLGRGEMIDFKL